MVRRKPPVGAFPIINPHAAGIDVHAAHHWVAVPPGSAPAASGDSDDLPPEVRVFGTCTADLEAIRRMGCDIGQGYLIARPMPKTEFATLLRDDALQLHAAK